MKKFKKLIPALCMLLVSAVLLGSSTYAWFSMNNKVTVTGMQISTKVSSNLFIANSASDAKKVADSEFKSALNQAIDEKIQPVSTINGTTFYYTNDAKADGSKQNDLTQVPYTELTNNTITISNVNYKGYVDQVFELKAVNTSNGSATLKLDTLNILYNGAAANTTAFRVALFCQEKTDSATASENEVANYYSAFASVSSIFAMKDAENFEKDGTTNKAVSATDSKSTVTYGTAFTKSVPAGQTAYYKITMRLWLEGEDTTCNSTKFMTLTDKWSLDLSFTLDEGTSVTSVTEIGTTANTTLNKADTNELTAAMVDTNEDVKTYEWYKVGTTEKIENATTNKYTPTETGTYYCVMTTQKGNVYRTPNVSVEIA